MRRSYQVPVGLRLFRTLLLLFICWINNMSIVHGFVVVKNPSSPSCPSTSALASLTCCYAKSKKTKKKRNNKKNKTAQEHQKIYETDDSVPTNVPKIIIFDLDMVSCGYCCYCFCKLKQACSVPNTILTK